jgi:hypothetical protein
VKDETTNRWAALWRTVTEALDRLERFMLWVAHWPRGKNAPQEGYSLGELLIVFGFILILGVPSLSMYHIGGTWTMCAALLFGTATVGVCMAALLRGLNRQKADGIPAERRSLHTPRSLRLPVEFLGFGLICFVALIFAQAMMSPTVNVDPWSRFIQGVLLALMIPALLVGIAGLFDYRICLAVGGKTSKLRMPLSIRVVAWTLYYGGFAAGAYVAFRVFY